MKYYWCVNCGYTGVFDFNRLRNAKCESCDYDALTEYDEEEWKEEGMQEKHERQKKDPYYDGNLKYKKTKTVGKDGKN